MNQFRLATRTSALVLVTSFIVSAAPAGADETYPFRVAFEEVPGVKHLVSGDLARMASSSRCAYPTRWAFVPKGLKAASMIGILAGRTAACGCPKATARHGSRKGERARSRSSCTSRCGRTRSRNSNPRDTRIAKASPGNQCTSCKLPSAFALFRAMRPRRCHPARAR